MGNLIRKSKSFLQRSNEPQAPQAPQADSDDAHHAESSPVNNTRSLSSRADLPPPLPLPSKDSPGGLFQHFSSIRNHRKSRTDLSTAVGADYSFNSLSQLHRRLVRKASTFNLHTRHRTGNSPQKDSDTDRRSRSEQLFSEPQTEGISPTVRPGTVPEELASDRPNTSNTETICYSSSSRPSTDSGSIYSQHTVITARRHTLPHIYDSKPLPDPFSAQTHSPSKRYSTTSLIPQPFDLDQILQAQSTLYATYQSYREYQETRDPQLTCRKMATPTADPPLSYDKLRTIAVEACDAALAGTTHYDHSKTPTWNTTIINTILSQLVGETQSQLSTTTTTEKSSTDPAVQWKFLVNSTIVQDRQQSSSSSEATTNGTAATETKKSGGRRGMHAAAGAYWNNEKDGMWSFKYEAAEGMGLDVVVLVVWVAV